VEGHAAEAELGDEQAGVAESFVLHEGILCAECGDDVLDALREREEAEGAVQAGRGR
jgi:hypothetical protein